MIVLGIAGSACAENAALEITLDLPPSRVEMLRSGAMGERRFAQVQVQRPQTDSPELDFSPIWTDPSDEQSIPLAGGTMRTVEEISVLTEHTGTNLYLKVRFCVDPSCGALDDDGPPEAWFALEHPFYTGERTRWTTLLSDGATRIPSIPEPPVAGTCAIDCADFDCEPSGCGISFVDKCEIAGCVSGAGTNFCLTGTDTHSCERE